MEYLHRWHMSLAENRVEYRESNGKVRINNCCNTQSGWMMADGWWDDGWERQFLAVGMGCSMRFWSRWKWKRIWVDDYTWHRLLWWSLVKTGNSPTTNPKPICPWKSWNTSPLLILHYVPTIFTIFSIASALSPFFSRISLWWLFSSPIILDILYIPLRYDIPIMYSIISPLYPHCIPMNPPWCSYCLHLHVSYICCISAMYHPLSDIDPRMTTSQGNVVFQASSWQDLWWRYPSYLRHRSIIYPGDLR